MGTVAPFRIKGGISLDGKVEFQVFSSAPSGAKADKMGVGSLAVAGDTGKWYRKTTIGAGPDKWAALATDLDLLGVAPSWKEPVFAVDTTLYVTKEAAVAEVFKRKFVGGTPLGPITEPSDVKRILFANIQEDATTEAYSGIFTLGMFPQAEVSIEALTGARLVVNSANDAASSLAGNDWTLTMTINNPANATSTTATIVGTAITVNLENNGTTSTATIQEVVAAIEAVDTDNKIYFRWTEGYPSIAEGAPTMSVPARASTNFSGGGNGTDADGRTTWTLGTSGVDLLVVEGDRKGDWNDWSVTTTTTTMDGDPATYMRVDEVNKVFLIHLGNNGAAITATIDDVDTALGVNPVSVTGRQYFDTVLQLDGTSDPGTNVIQAEDTATGTGGVGNAMRWRFQRVTDAQGNWVNSRHGFATYVQSGFDAGSTWIFSTDNLWVKQGASSTQESGFMQIFMGKNGNGSEMPTYSSTDVVTQGANLETAIGELDAEAGGTMGFVGKSEGDAMPSYGSTNAVTQSASLKDGISQLDLEVGYLQAFLGKAKGNEAPAYTTTKVVGQGTNLETAVSTLDDLLGAAKKESASANITTEVVVDSIIMEQDLAAEWIVHAREVANPGNVYASKVFAIHNANIGLAATQADFAESFILETGQKITGFEISMDMEVAGPLNARTMRLLISSTDAVDVTLSREVLRRTA